MIEAVNSSIATAQTLRGSAEQISSSREVVDIAPPSSSSESPKTPKAPYVSPYISIDTDSNKAVLQIRDSETGDVTQQFPTKSRLAQLSQLQAREFNSSKPTGNESSDNTSNEQLASIITVQDVVSSAPSNTPSLPPQVAIEAISSGYQQSSQPSSVSVIV